MSMYSSKWKKQMTVEEVINELTQIKKEFGKDLLVNCFDREDYYQPLTQINVRSFNVEEGNVTITRTEVCFDTM